MERGGCKAEEERAWINEYGERARREEAAMRLEHKRRERPLSWPEGGKEEQRAAVANVKGSARRRQPKLPDEERLLKEKYDGMKLESDKHHRYMSQRRRHIDVRGLKRDFLQN